MPQTRNVEITPGKGEPVVINVSQGDIGREITLNLKDGSGWFDLTGCTAKLAGIKPSGLGFTVDGVVSGHAVTITTVKLMTAEYGHIACELKITKTGITIGTANMILAVEKDPHPESTTDGNVDELIPEITILVERIEAAVAKAEVLFESEAWARGTRDGVPVDEEDPTYHNNSKYYKELAGGSASDAASHAADALSSKQNAAASATSANQSKLDAEAAAGDAEHYAELAASVFHVEGDVTFAVAADGGVSMIFTEE